MALECSDCDVVIGKNDGFECVECESVFCGDCGIICGDHFVCKEHKRKCENCKGKFCPVCTDDQCEGDGCEARFCKECISKLEEYDSMEETFVYCKPCQKEAKIKKEKEKQLRDHGKTFTYSSDFDENGILFWLGTAQKTRLEFVNPCENKDLVVATESHSASGNGVSAFGREAGLSNFISDANYPGWFQIEFKTITVFPSFYTIRTDAHGCSMRNWDLAGSVDGQTWLTLSSHRSDPKMSDEPNSSASWPVQKHGCFKFFPITQTEVNNLGSQYFMMCGFELYDLKKRTPSLFQAHQGKQCILCGPLSLINHSCGSRLHFSQPKLMKKEEFQGLEAVHCQIVGAESIVSDKGDEILVNYFPDCDTRPNFFGIACQCRTCARMEHYLKIQ